MDNYGLNRRAFLCRAAGLAVSSAGTLAHARAIFGQAPAIVTSNGSGRPWRSA